MAAHLSMPVEFDLIVMCSQRILCSPKINHLQLMFENKMRCSPPRRCIWALKNSSYGLAPCRPSDSRKEFFANQTDSSTNLLKILTYLYCNFFSCWCRQCGVSNKDSRFAAQSAWNKPAFDLKKDYSLLLQLTSTSNQCMMKISRVPGVFASKIVRFAPHSNVSFPA